MTRTNDNLERSNGVACLGRGAARRACRVVLGLGHSGFAVNAAEQLRASGWEVTTAATAEDARRMAVRGRAAAVVVGMTGDMTETAKVAVASPRKAKLVVVAPARDGRVEQQVGFLGATFAAEADGVARLVRLVTGE
jgi:UDP-N-acetylmuramoylalanine-D-glutamate ligase